MIALTDKETGASLGTIRDEELQFLIAQLEEEGLKDQDYYINKATLELFKTNGISNSLLKVLTDALGDREDMEIVWASTEG